MRTFICDRLTSLEGSAGVEESGLVVVVVVDVEPLSASVEGGEGFVGFVGLRPDWADATINKQAKMQSAANIFETDFGN